MPTVTEEQPTPARRRGGYPKEFRRDAAARGHCVNHKRTERLMAEHGIVARDGRRKKVRTTIPDVPAPPLPDLVQRDFAIGEPGQRTCGDITYISTEEGWLYLADVLDVGWRRRHRVLCHRSPSWPTSTTDRRSLPGVPWLIRPVRWPRRRLPKWFGPWPCSGCPLPRRCLAYLRRRGRPRSPPGSRTQRRDC